MSDDLGLTDNVSAGFDTIGSPPIGPIDAGKYAIPGEPNDSRTVPRPPLVPSDASGPVTVPSPAEHAPLTPRLTAVRSVMDAILAAASQGQDVNALYRALGELLGVAPAEGAAPVESGTRELS
jgi:hypothetical protein